MKSLSELIGIYRALLNNMWDQLQGFALGNTGDSFLDDWKQSNWELIVESNLCEEERVFLEPYGEGADYYGESSRIIQPEALPTHAVYCQSEKSVIDRLTGTPIFIPKEGLPLECFVALREGWYYEEPPFDCVLIMKDDEQLVFKIEDIRFVLTKI